MWQQTNNQLYRHYRFASFEEAFNFIARVAALARLHNHHPTIKNSYNEVELWLSTHAAGNTVTDKDHRLAEAIDALGTTASGAPAQPLAAGPESVQLYADGGSRGNPGPSASGYVLMNPAGKIIKKSGLYLGTTTNNQAEYRALLLGLEEAARMGARRVDVFMDSLLVINQMKGLYKVKNAELKPTNEAIKHLASGFEAIRYQHVPRELNRLADAEVNLILDAEADGGRSA